MTSNTINCFANWQDVKAVLEHVHKKYGLDEETGEKVTRMYAYGCSMGANQVGLYLINEGKRAAEILDGACLYGTPWHCRDNNDYFINNLWGIPQRVVSLTLNHDLWKKVLPKMKPYLSEETYKQYEHAFETNKVGIDHLNQKVIEPMYGFKTHFGYLDYCTLAGRLSEISVPTFGLSAVDDAMCGDFCLPRKEIQASNSKVCVATTNYGNHACHLTGTILPKSWYQIPCMEFFEFLEKKHKGT